jgi:hypothetical protein
MKINKRYRKPRVQSRIENLHTLASLGIQDTGGRQTKQKQNKTQKPIKIITMDPTNHGHHGFHQHMTIINCDLLF